MTCTVLAAKYGAATCLHSDRPALEHPVIAGFFAALAPAELDVLDDVIAYQTADNHRRTQHYADQLTRAEYEARLAQRQYQAVDPDNRLITAERERQREKALDQVAEARRAAEQFAQNPPVLLMTETQRCQLRDLARVLPDLWQSGRLTVVQQKELLRCLMRTVIITRPEPNSYGVTIVWVSGASTALTIAPMIARQSDVAQYD